MNTYEIEVTGIDGVPKTLGEYRGKVLLVVNVASRCGYTPQYAALEALYRRHKDAGLVVLGFPCNQFGKQEPADEAEILRFCTAQYGVTFPLFAKVDVNGPNAHPLFVLLRSKKKGLFGRSAIAWNFSKFLIDRHGEVVRRFGSRDKPDSIEPIIAELL